MQLLLRDTTLAELLLDKKLVRTLSTEAEDRERRIVIELAKLTVVWINDPCALSDTEPVVQALGGPYLETELGYHGLAIRSHQCLLEAITTILQRLDSGIHQLLGQQASVVRLVRPLHNTTAANNCSINS